MDLLMEGKEGIEPIVEMRRRKSHVKIIAISGGAVGNLDSAARLGADHTLRKPFSPETMLTLIKRALG